MIIIVIISFLLFLFYLTLIHNAPVTSNSKVVKMYIDGITYEIEGQEIKHPHSHIAPNVSHFDELIQSISDLIKHRQVFDSKSAYSSLKELISLPIAQKYINNQGYPVEDPVAFNPHLGFGGCYFENKQEVGSVCVIGEPSSIIKLCSHIHDKEEILRIAAKWQKQNFICIAVASGDVGHRKNVLKRGVKDKMMLLGLLAIQN